MNKEPRNEIRFDEIADKWCNHPTMAATQNIVRYAMEEWGNIMYERGINNCNEYHRLHPNQWQASREEWIEIKEGCEMPEVFEDVLMFVESSLSNGKIVRTIYTGFRDDYEGWHFGEEGEHIGPERKATHWRKLPEAPKLNK
jgi:hypothetical protein